MQKLVLILLLSFGFISANAQTRHCGTSEYYELRKKQDPKFEQRMADDEKRLQERIKQSQAEQQKNLESSLVNLPSIKGFVKTGNLEVDRTNYAKAKMKVVPAPYPKYQPGKEERALLVAKKRAAHQSITK